MLSDNNKILIKDKGGQFKTVSLNDDQKQKLPQKPIVKKQDDIEPVKPAQPVVEKKEEIKQPVKPVEPVVQKEPPKQESKVPSFYFNVSDEEEVAKFKNKGNEDVRQKKEEMLKNEAQRFMKMIPRDLPVDQQSKFEKILVSYLRGVRTELEVGEILVRESGKGGFGFEREEVRKFIKDLKNKKIFFEGLTLDKIKELKKVEEVKKEETPKPETSKVSEKKDEVVIVEKQVEEVKKEETPKPETSKVSEKKDEVVIVEKQVEKQEEVVQDILSTMDKNKAPKVQEIVSPQQKQQEPVKHVKISRPAQQPAFSTQQKKTQGPTEELLNLTLEEFRSFGSNAKERVNKIYEKINLLEEESIDKKNQGISAWKNSAVYKEYVKVGEESLSNSASIEEAVDKNGKISIDEFNSIADLNEQLNY